MKIKVRLFATLSKYNCTEAISRYGDFETSPGSTVKDIISRLSIPEEEVNIISVNGNYSSLQQALNPEDRLAFFPCIISK